MDEQQPTEVAELPPYIIEEARSSRSRCKTCRRPIAKGALRLGVLVEGPYGAGHMWHHLTCAARRRPDDVREAYAAEAWRAAKHPPATVPELETLEREQERAAERRQQRKEIPWAELAPSGRSKCKECGEPIEEGSVRVVVGREVRFGEQVRVGPIKVHPRCVRRALEAEDSATPPEDLEEALRQHSDLPSERLEAALAEIRAAG